MAAVHQPTTTFSDYDAMLADDQVDADQPPSYVGDTTPTRVSQQRGRVWTKEQRSVSVRTGSASTIGALRCQTERFHRERSP
jgi:hypothetical protein